MNCNMGMEAEIYPFLPTLLLVLVCHCRGKSEECFATLEQNAVVRAIDKKYIYLCPSALHVRSPRSRHRQDGLRVKRVPPWCLLDYSLTRQKASSLNTADKYLVRVLIPSLMKEQPHGLLSPKHLSCYSCHTDNTPGLQRELFKPKHGVNLNFSQASIF